MKSAVFAALALSVIAYPSDGPAQTAPKRPPLPNFDQRAAPSAAAEAASAEQKAAAEHLRALVPQVKVDFDPVTGAAKRVAATDGFLTGVNGAGKAVSAAVASKQAVGDPYGPTKAFLQEYSRLFGHGAEALGTARVAREYVTPHNGLRTVVWQQQVGGIGVFEGVLISHTTKRGELVNISSQFLPDAAGAASRGVAAGSAAASAPGVSARQAVALAAQNVGETLTEDKVVAGKDAPAGAEQQQKFTGPGLKGEADAKVAWLPLDKQTLRLCWDVTLMSRSRGEMFRLLVDASSGKVLLRRCLTSYLSDASYRVYTSDSPSPLSPGYSIPVSTQPPLVDRTLVTVSALDTNASPAGWINDGDNQTLGNNVDAHTDWNADNLPDLPRPQGSPARVFDFAMDLSTQDPTNYASAAVVQLFYLCNVYHDRLYELGFTEAAGNFQTTNFNRGGLGNDAVQADAQDGSGTDNANFSTPADGLAGRMQMYIFTGPSPRRDGDFDAEVVFHEHTHGLSWRLVGGGQALGDTQSDGMGEGWSDFYALSLLSEAGDDVNGVYACGAYASYKIGGAGDTSNYYFGIRRYPYTTDMTKNPLTFKDIDPAQAAYCSSSAPYHTGMFGACSASLASEVHNEGEVWCAALWDARANIINKLGWAAGNQLMLQLTTDGMKLTPAHPNFLQARDAILQADLVDTGGANQHELWAGFAKRGMGFSATSPASSTTTGIHEAYDMPDDLRITPLTGFVSRGPVGGPFTTTTISLVLTNTGNNTLNWAAANTATWLSVEPSAGTLLPGGPATSVTASLAASATNLPMGVYTATVWFTNLSSLVAQNCQFTLRVGQPDYFTEVFTSGLSALAYHAFTFTPDGSSSSYSVCAQPVTTFFTDPTGGTSVSLADDSYASATITGGNTVAIYSTRSSVFYIGSNGYITMNAGDISNVGTAANHFNLPRVSAVFYDLNPASGGNVNWRQLADRVAVTYQAVPIWTVDNYPSMPSTFQIELFFDGRIRLTYLAVNATSGLVGLSAGTGVPASFTASDFTSYGPCTPLALVLPNSAAENAGVLTNAGVLYLGSILPTNLTVSLSSSDPARLTVPSSATILAGQVTTNFDLMPVDNAVQDGNELVTVTASANGFTNTSASTLVIDDDTPPSIAIQPVSQAIIAGNSVTFSITATGQTPLCYFWHRNGSPIPDATGSSYTTNAVQLADSGSVFSCLVSNSLGTALSSNAVLTVVPDRFTEWFSASPHAFDLGYKTFTFTPDGSSNYYAVCQQPAAVFPTDPAGGTTVTLSDDSYAQETLTGGNTIAIYNRQTNVFFIGSNGYLTVGSGDMTWTASTTNHFNLPRVSALFRDLNPGSAGTISWKQLSDRAAVTYQNVPEYGTTETNSFQVELFYDGRIRVTYLQIAAAYPLVGLSAGLGIPDGFLASDFSTDNACVLLPPVIVTQPTNVAVPQGSNATFSVVASGALPLSYQWRFNGGNLSGATSSSYTLASAQPANAGSYSVVINNSDGSVTSSNAVLSVLLPPTISAGPTSAAVGLGQDATFAATAGGTPPLSYQWQFDGTNLDGSTNISLILSNAQAANAGTYRLVVTNLYGAITSTNALLTVLDPFIISQPQSQMVAAGAPANFSVGAVSSLPLSYRWFKEGLPLADGGGITSAQTATLAVASAQGSDMGHYFAVVSNYNGSVTSSTATLLGPFAPVILTQPAGQTAMAGSAVSYTVTAFGPGTLSFQWRQAGTNLADGGKFSGSAAATLVVTNAQAGEMANYSVVVSNTYGPVTSAAAGLSLWPLASWGQNTYDQADVPWGLSNVTAVAAGYLHNLALKPDGTVAAWGAGKANSGTNPQYGQSLVPAGLSNVVGIACGSYHSLALKSDRTAIAWGAGATNAGSSPHMGQSIVPVGLTNLIMVAGGGYHSLALKVDGTVVAWGAGAIAGANPNYGQAQVPAGLTNVVAVAAGGYHSLALRTDGTVVAWGAGMTSTGISPNYGQSVVPAGLSNVVAVAAGIFHSLALKADGSVVAWGAGTVNTATGSDYGQAMVPSGLTNVAALAAGAFHSLALKSDGTVVAWGAGTTSTGTGRSYGQAIIPAPLSEAVAVTGGGFHTLALEGDGRPCFTVQPLSHMAVSGATVALVALAVGSPPLSYQWECNGTNLTEGAHTAGSQDSTLTLANVLAANAGSYQLIVTNGYGAATSVVAVLQLLNPPSITRQPADQRAMPGCTATFRATLSGTAPLSCQWQKNGLSLDGQTNATLVLGNVQTADFGSYTLVVTNAYGAAASSNAVLSLDHVPVTGPDTIQRFTVGGVRVHVATLLANDTDVDGDALAISAVSSNSAAGGTVNLSGDWVFYLPPPGSTAPDTFTYTVTDGHCATAEGTVTVEVKDTSNPAPAAFIESAGAGSLRVTCDGVPGYAYRIQYASDLTTPQWQDVGTFTADAWGTCEYVDQTLSNVTARFYRAVFP